MRLLCSLLSLFGIGASVGLLGQDRSEIRAEFERRAFVVRAPATREALPSRVVNTTYLPTVTSQGPLGTCGAYGVTYYYRTFLKARQSGWASPDPTTQPERCASTSYTYKLLRHDPQAGANILGTALNMLDFGVCTLADMPYNAGIDTFTWPEEEFWKKAMPWRPLAAGQIPALHTLAGQAVLKSHLYGGGAGDMAVIALRNAPNVVEYPGGMHTGNDVLYALQEDAAGIQHAFTVIGYDDDRTYLDERDGVTKSGAFLVVNSWGQDWGVGLDEIRPGGFAWIAYDLFLKDLQDERNGEQAAVVMLERGDYTPETMLRVELSGDTRILSGGLAPSGEGGEWISLFPGKEEDARPTDQGIWIDVTDLLASGSAGLRLHVWQYTGTAAHLEELKLSNWDETRQLPWTDPAPVQIAIDFMAPTRRYIGRYQTRITAPEPVANGGDAAWYDWNGDGLPEAAVTGPGGTWIWTHDAGRAGLTTTAEPSFPAGHTLRWLDANGDGHIDLLVAADAETKIYAGDGTGGFGEIIAALPGCRRGAIAVADFDRDGRPDLALGENTETSIHLNAPPGFGKSRESLPALSTLALSHGTLAAADVDGDGRPDLLLAGIGAVGHNDPGETKLYRNAGLPLHFVQMATALPQVRSPAVAFGDADGDGALDLAISGCTAEKWVRLYVNDGSGSFQERKTALPPLRAGTLQWCDLDGDGRPDLVATGATTDDWFEPSPKTIAALNRADGTFADFGLPLPDAHAGFLVAQDVNGDANPDLLLGGSTTQGNETDPSNLVCALYDYGVSEPGLFPVNTPPTPPANLACTHTGGGIFTFTWDPGTDAETPIPGLRYEWRCGRAAGMGDIVHGEMARSGVQLRQPPVGTLHWQVRTMDSAGVLSAWSAVQETEVNAYTAAYHLRLESSPAWGGSLEASAASPIAAGTAVTLTATAGPGFEFVGWEGDTQGMARSEEATFTMHEDRWIQAVFAAKASPVLPVWTLARETIMQPGDAWFYHTRGHTLESFAGKLVRLGGLRADNLIVDMILTSTDDGATWRYSADRLPSPRYDHVSAVFAGKLWIAGGTGSGGKRRDVWYTTDLVTWTQATAEAPWAGRQGASLVVAHGKLWYLGGADYEGLDLKRYCDVWHTTDGVNWTAVPTPAGWVQSGFYQAGDELPWAVRGTPVRATALDDVLYATDGRSVWSSPDGVAWTLLVQEPTPPMPLPDGVVACPFEPLHKFTFTSYDGELVLLGGEKWRLGETTNDVWNSPDGRAWTRTAPASRSHWSPRRHPATCVHDGKLFLVGGETAASAPLGDVWHCVPGVMPPGMGGLVIEATPLSPWISGTTEPQPGFYVDDLGTVFSIRAVPAYGYILDHWEGAVADDGDGDPATVNITLAGEEMRVKAVFTAAPRLTVRTDPHGAGTTVPQAQTAYSYPPNEWVALSAKARPGYTFTHWTGPVEDPSSPTTRVFMDAAHEVVATFRLMPVPNRMSCANDWAAVIRDGVVWGLGSNGKSQMGHELPVESPGEFWPVALFSGAEAVYAESNGAKVVCTDGSMVAWGSGYLHYLLGVKPHPAFTSLSNVAQCAGGGNTSGLFRKTDGTLVDYLNRPIQAGFGAGAVGDLIDIASSGAAHFAVDSAGLLYAWGSNLGGQLGIAGLESSDAPREVPGISRVYATVLGLDGFRPFTLALRNDGTVWSWGDPRGGQLGRVPSEDEPAERPAPVPGLANIVKLAAGSNHALALTHDGQLYAWGTNQFGQLGTGGFDNEPTPVPLALETRAVVVDVAAGPFYALLQLADGSFRWMGATPGDPSTPLTLPTAIPGLGAGYAEGRLIVQTDPADADGTIYPPPGEHPVALGRPIHLRARDGERHAFAHWSTSETAQDAFLSLAGDTTLAARFRFAYGAQARLTVQTSGNGTTDPAPGTHEYAPGTVLALAALPAAGHAFSHWEGEVAETDNARTTVLMDRDHTVRACFAPVAQAVPPRVATGLGGIHDALVLRSDATVHYYRAAGGNVFVRINADNDPLTGCLRLAASSSGLCLALAQDGTLWSWGGDGTLCGWNQPEGALTTFPASVVDAFGTLRNVRDAKAGDDFGLGLLADGTIRTWGYNAAGQLGHSPAAASVPLARPVVEADGRIMTGVRAADAGGQFAVAARDDGTVVAWGANDHGQLGDQALPPGSVPVAVAGVSGIVNVAAGRDFAAALDGAGQVWTWGRNDVGQCGRSARDAVAAPGLVADLPPIAELALGHAHALARDRNGNVWAWGSGADGRLGDGEAVDRATPVRVVSPDGAGHLEGIVTVDCAAYSYAIGGDGRIYSWGFSEFGVPYPRPTNHWTVGSDTSADSDLRVLSLACFPPEGGTLSPGAGVVTVSRGTFLTVAATANPGYRFLHWTGGGPTTAERILGIRLVADTQLTAHFAPLEPRLRLGQAVTTAGRNAFLDVFLEGDTAPVEGISARFALPEGLRFANGVQGTRLPGTFEVRAAFADERTATVLVSGPGDVPSLAPDAELPVYVLEVHVPDAFPPGDYPVHVLPDPAVAIAAGRTWVEPLGTAGTVTVLPEGGVDLLFAMQQEPGDEDDRDERPQSGLTSIRQGREYVAELWLRDQRPEGSPIANVRLDVNHDDVAACLGFAPVGLIGAPTGTIAAGSIAGFGGALSVAPAPGAWYRLGALRFVADAIGSNQLAADPEQVVLTLADASVLPTAAIELWPGGTVQQEANQAPAAQASLPLVASWGTQVFGQLLGSDPNPDDAPVYALVEQPQHGTIELDATTGEFVYTPMPFHAGADSFSFAVSDGDEVSATVVQSLYVTAGWCVALNRGDDWAMFGREPDANDQPDDPGDLAAADEAPLAFVPPQGRPAVRLQRDIRGPTGNVAWRLEVPARAGNTTLAWNPGRVPAGLRLLRISPVVCPLGGERSLEMFWHDAVPLAAGTEYVFDLAMPTDLALDIDFGWNLICLPGRPVFADPTLGQPDPPGEGAVWSWREQAYVRMAEVEPYTGYWFYAAQSGLQFFPILPAFARDLPIEAGWNVIGVPRPYRTDVLFAPGTTIWRYGRGRYARTQFLDPGEGYWLYSAEPGLLDLTEDDR